MAKQTTTAYDGPFQMEEAEVPQKKRATSGEYDEAVLAFATGEQGAVRITRTDKELKPGSLRLSLHQAIKRNELTAQMQVSLRGDEVYLVRRTPGEEETSS